VFRERRPVGWLLQQAEDAQWLIAFLADLEQGL
jgi:hypothetical protein